MIYGVCLSIMMAWAAPEEQYSRLQIHYTNQMRETSSGQSLPAQDFKRYALKATFTDGALTYTLTIHRAFYGDMIYFLVLGKQTQSRDSSRDSVRAFRVGEDRKSIEEVLNVTESKRSYFGDGSVRSDFTNSRYAPGAYALIKTQPWMRNGTVTEADYIGMNEDVGADATILGAHQTTYALPISLAAFRASLSERLRVVLDGFRASFLRGEDSPDSLWSAISVADIGEMAPARPKPRVLTRTTPHFVPDPRERSWYERMIGVFR